MKTPTLHRARPDVTARGARVGVLVRPRRRSLLALLLFGLVLVPQMPWFGCTPQRRYEVLSLFFDGVPDPNAPPPGTVEFDEQGNPVVRAVSFAHKPFEEGNCGACHATATGSFDDFEKVDDSVCMKCHGDVPTEYPRMHGPVALAQCSLCHLPHESSVKPLLLDEPAALCSNCHLRELLPADPPDHFTDRNCLDCHSGHGGEARGLLRAGWKSGAGTTQPASAAPGSGR